MAGPTRRPEVTPPLTAITADVTAVGMADTGATGVATAVTDLAA